MRETEDRDGSEQGRSPHYWALKRILDDAGIVLVPTDRDLAPSIHELDEDEQDDDEQEDEA